VPNSRNAFFTLENLGAPEGSRAVGPVFRQILRKPTAEPFRGLGSRRALAPTSGMCIEFEVRVCAARVFGHPAVMRPFSLRVLTFPVVAHAQYATDASAPLAIRATTSDDVQPKHASAPNGGSYLSYFSGTGYDVRLTRLDANGNAVWKAGDLLIEDRTNSSTTDYGLASDALGNAYVAYEVGSSIICTSVSPEGAICGWRQRRTRDRRQRRLHLGRVHRRFSNTRATTRCRRKSFVPARNSSQRNGREHVLR
jgi:hypothetical protein